MHHRVSRSVSIPFSVVSCIAFVFAAAACSSSATKHGAPAPLDGGGSGTSNEFGNPSADGSLPMYDASGHFLTFEERPCPAGSTLSYQNFGSAFFSNHCEGCHGSSMMGLSRNSAPVGVYFDTQAEIQALRKKIWDRAGDENHMMPPIGVVTMPERVQLGEWLACGAK
jgi:hypothetical protein